MAAGVGQFFCATARANTQQLASVSPQVLPGGSRTVSVGSWTRTPNRLGTETDAERHSGAQRLDEKAVREEAPFVGWGPLRVAAGFGLARFCLKDRLAALTEHASRSS